MAVRDWATRREVPLATQEAIERGLVSQEQLRELIETEAEWIDLSFDEAVRRAVKAPCPDLDALLSRQWERVSRRRLRITNTIF